MQLRLQTGNITSSQLGVGSASADTSWVQLQFSGHQYVAVQFMRTAGSPNANVVVPNRAKPPPPAVILTLTLTLTVILIKTTNPTQQKGRRNNCLCL